MAGTLGEERAILEWLLGARLWVSRLGEWDVRRWWRTDGVLGPDGAYVGPRVLPRTHATGRARIVFAVARHACKERHPAEGIRHLFSLDPETEDRLDQLLVDKLADHGYWQPMMAKLEAVTAAVDPEAALLDAGLATEADLRFVAGLPLGPAERSLPIPATGDPTADLRRLIAGFVRSKPGALAVPCIAEGARR